MGWFTWKAALWIKEWLRQDGVWSESIRMTTEGGFAVLLTNNTGGASIKGQVLEPSTTVDNAVETAAINAVDPMGVFYESGVADGDEAWVVISGLVDILIDAGGSTRGDWLGTGATGGSAVSSNSPPAAPTHFQEIGHSLETRVGAGLARAVFHFN